jgi:rhodanese-related sulfurtransferase
MATFLAVGLVGTLVVVGIGNLVIYGATRWAKSHIAEASQPDMPGVRNFQKVDERVWRGAAPSPLGYRMLAAQGVLTDGDLRAEDKLEVDDGALRHLGINRVHIPVRDGQAPSSQKVEQVLQTLLASEGKVFLHCGAGVGRTGTMAAAYLVSTGQAGASEALRRNLAVGPPSLEQVAFVAELTGSRAKRPASALVAFSRALDAPRRIWSHLTT